MASKFANPLKKTDYTRPGGRLPQFWSFSRWEKWSLEAGGCHLRYALAHIWKLVQPESRAMERGIDIHKKAEGYLLGNIHGIPQELEQFRDEFAAVRKLGAIPEAGYTFTKTWQQTHAKDWDNAWLRMKVDIELLRAFILDIIDVKSGKEREKHATQAEIYGMGGLTKHKKVERVEVEYWYVDSGAVGHHEFERGELRALKKKWRAEANKMLGMRVFKPAGPGHCCDWCPFRSDKKLRNGEPGPCESWRK